MKKVDTSAWIAFAFAMTKKYAIVAAMSGAWSREYMFHWRWRFLFCQVIHSCLLLHVDPSKQRHITWRWFVAVFLVPQVHSRKGRLPPSRQGAGHYGRAGWTFLIKNVGRTESTVNILAEEVWWTTTSNAVRQDPSESFHWARYGCGVFFTLWELNCFALLWIVFHFAVFLCIYLESMSIRRS